jgi:uncharacterized protein DUF6159
MGTVRIHCYGCSTTVSVEERAAAQGLQTAGWAVAHGQTFCPACAAQRGLPASTPGQAAGEPAPITGPGSALESFPIGEVSRERRGRRTMRLLRASLAVLREDPRLLVFPATAMALSLLIGVLCFGVSFSGFGSGSTRGSFFLASLIAAYPVNFVSIYSGVALATVLAGRLEGRPLTPHDGWMAARERVGIIAGWTLLTCTVGAILRLIEQYVPLGARIVVAIVDLSWSLVTIFAVPVLAYENLGPLETFRRSSGIFRQRWGTQLGGLAAIGVGSVFMFLPFVVLMVAGAATAGGTGVLLLILGGAGLFVAIAAQAALDQIFRVFVYRSAVGLDTSAGPFAPGDLQAPFAARRRRSR